MNALIVDDSRAMRLVLRQMLAALGFGIAEARHGREALTYLQMNPATDVALVDWNMPEMNGFDFLVAARGNPAWKDTVIMMVTTETEMSQMQRALEAGANEYVMKPFTKDVLREKLQLVGLAAG